MDRLDGPSAGPRPVVGITCCRRMADGFAVHSTGEKYVTAVHDAAGAFAVLVPALGSASDLDTLLATIDGVLLTGSPSNIEPRHYSGGAEPAGNVTDPARDATTLPLVTRAITTGVPLLGLCRGVQEINVALGGSLHQQLHTVEARFDHRSDKSLPATERYGPRHRVDLVPGGYLATLLGATTVEVNSLHGQGINRVADGLVVEAVADDGTVEAIRAANAPAFALGVQWHPEYRPLENRVSTRLFRAFGDACRARARRRHAIDVA